MPKQPLHPYALYALSEGWDPIPVWGVDDSGVCQCAAGTDCRSPGKHPTQKAWQEQPRLSGPDVFELFGDGVDPVLNIGLRTGDRSGLWVLDIDPKSGGGEALLGLQAEHGPLPETRAHTTGSGGRHYLFNLPDFPVTNSRGRLPRGIDVRGNGGFVVAPGSVSGVGRYSTHSAAAVADAPEWLLDLIRPEDPTGHLQVVDTVAHDELDAASAAKAARYLESAVGAEVARLRGMRESAVPDMSQYRGEPWNQGVYEVSCNLLELAQSSWLAFTLDDVRRILSEEAPTDRGFTLADVNGCLNSAFSRVRGQARPMPASITQSSWDILTSGIRHVPKAPETGEAVTEWPREDWTQVGNAKRTIRMAAGRLAYVPETGDWFERQDSGAWATSDQPYWGVDVVAKWCARAMEAAAVLEAGQYSTEPPKDGRSKDTELDRFVKFMAESSKVEMHTAVATQLRRRAVDWGLAVPASQFDSVNFEFAASNGIVNLRTGEIRGIGDGDFVSKVSPVAYDPKMPIPNFLRFLETSHPDGSMRDFLQKVLGYSMTGEYSEQRMFIHHGAQTANGKSVLMNVVSKCLGAHLAPASEKTIIRQKNMSAARIGQDMVDLRGRRMLVLSETQEGGILDAETVKSITSGDLRADRPHAKANLQYRITGKIHLMTNHLPHITPDPAMRRRLTIIPWTQSFEENPDPLLGQKLERELPGILAWMVQGAVRWYEDFGTSGKTGLELPAAAEFELAEFIEEEDEVGQWLAERAFPTEEFTSSFMDLYRDYELWRPRQGFSGLPLSKTMFGRRLTSKGHPTRVVRQAGGIDRFRCLGLKPLVLPGALV